MADTKVDTKVDTKPDTKPATEAEVETTPERKQKRSPKATKESGESVNAAIVEKEFHNFISKLQSKYPTNMLAYQVSNLSEVSQVNQTEFIMLNIYFMI